MKGNSAALLQDNGSQNATLSREMLEKAFAHFSEAGKRLEDRYLALQREAELLREQLKAQELDIRRNEKLTVLGEYSTILAHEIRNPLGAIKLFCSLLSSEAGMSAGATKILGDMGRSVSSLEATINNVLQFSRTSNLTKSPLNVHNAILEELTILELRFADKLIIFKEISGSPWIVANEQSIRQIVSNLITNSAQASKGNCKVTVRVTGDVDQKILLEIHDNGPGIPKSVQERLFEPFVTGRAEGTGLGLALVKRIVDDHLGCVEVETQVGTKFKITLPRVQ